MSKSSVAVTCFLPGRAKDLSAPLYIAYLRFILYICEPVYGTHCVYLGL